MKDDCNCNLCGKKWCIITYYNSTKERYLKQKYYTHAQAVKEAKRLLSETKCNKVLVFKYTDAEVFSIKTKTIESITSEPFTLESF